MRLEVAALLMLIVLLLTALTSCFPQLPQAVLADPARLARWEAGLTGRYGRLTSLLKALNAFNCFRAPVFLLPWGLLLLTTLLCTLGRWRTVWRQALLPPVHPATPAARSAPYITSLPLPPAGLLSQEEQLLRLGQDLQRLLEKRGFRVRMAVAEGRTLFLCGERNRPAALATLLTHLAVLLLAVGLLASAWCGWRAEVTVGPGETVAIRHGSELALRQEGFAISRYPDGSAAGYEARVSVMEDGAAVASGTVKLNEPLSFRSVTIYLTGYAGGQDGYRVTFLVVHDPGYGPVICAGFLLLVGLTVSLNFPLARIQAKVNAEEILLTGQCERRAWEFDREFAAITGESERQLSLWCGG
jgi:cytochrome c biogenesis protein ResB